MWVCFAGRKNPLDILRLGGSLPAGAWSQALELHRTKAKPRSSPSRVSMRNLDPIMPLNP